MSRQYHIARSVDGPSICQKHRGKATRYIVWPAGQPIAVQQDLCRQCHKIQTTREDLRVDIVVKKPRRRR